MNKKYLLTTVLLFSLVFVGCTHISDSVNYPVGDVSEEKLLGSYQAFSKSYQEFEVNAAQKEKVKQWPESLKIEVFLGTWCHDSQREVPHLLKVLQGNEQVEVILIALDYQKSEPQGRAKLANVKYIPTFVVFLDEKEIGRIIERPTTTLVDDISTMLARY